MLTKVLCTLVLVGLFNHEASGDGLLCYRCTSSQPGCGTPFNWYLHMGQWCPEPEDKCVKVIERKGSTTMIIRGCLSTFRGLRTDIPADHHDDCRPAAKDVRLGHDVNNSISQLDIHRNHYDEVTWCFCSYDHRCNSATGLTISVFLIGVVAATRYIVA